MNDFLQLQAQEAQVQRRRDLALAMQAKAMQPMQGIQAGRVFVAPGIGATIANVLGGILAGRGVENQEQNLADIVQRKSQAEQGLFDQYHQLYQGTPSTEKPLPPELAGPPELIPGQPGSPQKAFSFAMTAGSKPLAEYASTDWRLVAEAMAKRMGTPPMVVEGRVVDPFRPAIPLADYSTKGAGLRQDQFGNQYEVDSQGRMTQVNKQETPAAVAQKKVLDEAVSWAGQLPTLRESFSASKRAMDLLATGKVHTGMLAAVLKMGEQAAELVVPGLSAETAAATDEFLSLVRGLSIMKAGKLTPVSDADIRGVMESAGGSERLQLQAVHNLMKRTHYELYNQYATAERARNFLTQQGVSVPSMMQNQPEIPELAAPTKGKKREVTWDELMRVYNKPAGAK